MPVILALLALAAVCACGTQVGNPTQFVLNGPSDIAFGCTGNIAADSDLHAFPPASCAPVGPALGLPDAGAESDPGPAFPGLPTNANAVFLIPEKAPGLLHVAVYSGGSAGYVDQDPFSPGLNGLAVGRLPVSAAVTGDGCWGVVSNSGSCDLTVVDVLRASLGKTDPIAARGVVSGLSARPGEIWPGPSLPAGTLPLPTCASPSGTIYVTYPSCHLVARVDLATFTVLDGIRFRAGAAPEIVGPDVTCPAECTNVGGTGAAEDADAGAGADAAQPVALALQSKVAQRSLTEGSVTTTDHGSATTEAIFAVDGARLYVVYAQVRDAGGAVPTSTVTGGGMTWTQAGTVADAGGLQRVSLFFATGRADGTPLTITHSAATADATQWIVQEIRGAHLDAPIRQVVTATGRGAPASLSLAEFGGDADGAVAGFGVGVGRDAEDHPALQLLSPDPAWTEVFELSSLGNGAGTLQAQFIGGRDLTPGARWQGCADATSDSCPTYVAIAAELALESTLYIGAGDSSRLLLVDVDGAGAPLTVTEVPLEGAGGIRRVASSGLIPMGNSGQAGQFNFVYAIGDDQSIHVVEDVRPDRPAVECDTQIDRRYLHDVTNLKQLACFRLGDTRNPPRRPTAIGPGIRLPQGVLPLDVTFTQGYGAQASVPLPSNLHGQFAVVSALGPTTLTPRGVLYWINVNDLDYPDFQRGISLQDPDIVFGLPHSIRDSVLNRWSASQVCLEDNYPDTQGQYRIAAGFPVPTSTDFPTNVTGTAKEDEFVPNLRRVHAEKIVATSATNEKDVCLDSDVLAYELAQLSPGELRSALWTDASLVGRTDTFTVTWEGALAQEDFRSRKTGGTVTIADGGRMRLDAPAANLCALGPQPRDIVRLLGCTTDGDCAIDESCYLHPSAPIGVSGMCVPTAQVIEFSADCEALLTTVRRYTAVEVTNDHAVFVTRPRTLPESPLGGCVDALQCQDLQEQLLSQRETAAKVPPGTVPRRAFTCAIDDGMGGPPRCMEICDDTNQCEPGSTCERSSGAASGRCVLGPIPPAKCIQPLQRYELRAGEAFTVVSAAKGYRHREVTDPATQACVVDPSKSPLLVSRFTRNEPPCTDTSRTSVTPNPCTLTGVQEPLEDANGTITDRPTHAVRIRTPGLSFDVVDLSNSITVTPPVGSGRTQTSVVSYSPIQFGFGFQMQVAAGGFEFIETDIVSNLPTRVRRGLNGVPWVVDSGASPVSGGTRGQIILVVGSSSDTAQSPVRLF